MRTYTYDYRNRLTGVDDSANPSAPPPVTVTPNITGGPDGNGDAASIAWFGGGQSYPAGTYRVQYAGGSLTYQVGGQGYRVNAGLGYGFFIKYDAGAGLALGPGADIAEPTAAQAVADSTGAFVVITTTSAGPIGMYLSDSPYSDNGAGSTGSPTFQLVAPLPPPVHVRYAYDADDRLVSTSVLDPATGQYAVAERDYYDGADLILVTDAAGDVASRYLYGPGADGNDQALAADTGEDGAAMQPGEPATTRWYVADRQGTVTDVLNADGVVVDHLTYDTYGNIVAQTQPVEQPRFGFQGMEIDQSAGAVADGAEGQGVGTDTGMYYDNARFYEPGTGRFLNQDPMGFAAGNPNLYGFVGNEPTGATDPSGMDPLLGGQYTTGSGGGSLSNLIGYQPYTIDNTPLSPNANPWGLASPPAGTSTGWSGITSSSTSTDANGLPVSNLSVQSTPGSGPAGYNLSPIPSNFSYVQLNTGNLTPAATLNATAAFANASQNMEATAWANSAGYAQMNRSVVEKSLDQFFDESPTEMALQFGQAALPLVIPEEGVAVAAEELLGEESAVAAVDYTADIGVAAKTIGTDSTLGAVAEGEAAPAAAESFTATSAISKEAAQLAQIYGTRTSGPVYDAIVNSARSLGYSGDIVVLRGAGSGAVGAGLSGNTMVVFENAYANGFSAGTRFLSGDALIAHEVGHTLAPIPYTLNLSADPQLALLREIQASVYGAGIKGLSAESQAQLLQDASNVAELYLKRH